jgi:hypothetical protein
MFCHTIYIYFNHSTAPWGPRPPNFSRLHYHTWDTPHSVGLLWTRDQLVAKTYTWQHTTLGGIRTHNPSKREAADPCLRPRGHWDRHHTIFHYIILFDVINVVPLVTCFILFYSVILFWHSHNALFKIGKISIYSCILCYLPQCVFNLCEPEDELFVGRNM